MSLRSKPQELRPLSEAFRALANPNRLAMYLELLRNDSHRVKRCALQDLVDLLDIGAPTVSHHTRELVSAGLIEVERSGRFMHCRINEEMRQRLARFFVDCGES